MFVFHKPILSLARPSFLDHRNSVPGLAAYPPTTPCSGTFWSVVTFCCTFRFVITSSRTANGVRRSFCTFILQEVKGNILSSEWFFSFWSARITWEVCSLIRDKQTSKHLRWADLLYFPFVVIVRDNLMFPNGIDFRLSRCLQCT